MGAKGIGRPVLGLLAAIGIAGALTGCGGQPVVAPPPEEPVTTPSADPTTEPAPEPQHDVLFTITANVRSVDGSTVGISMVAHAPVASTDPDAVDLKNEFLGICAAGNGIQPIDDQYLADQGSTLLLVELSTDDPGQEFVQPLDLFFGSPYFAQGASGDGIQPEPGGPTCFYGFLWTTSGSARGIADFENPDGQPDLTQWQYGHYGFTVPPDSGATIEACKVTISETGMKSGIDQISGWDPSLAATGISCGIGYSGE